MTYPNQSVAKPICCQSTFQIAAHTDGTQVLRCTSSKSFLSAHDIAGNDSVKAECIFPEFALGKKLKREKTDRRSQIPEPQVRGVIPAKILKLFVFGFFDHTLQEKTHGVIASLCCTRLGAVRRREKSKISLGRSPDDRHPHCIATGMSNRIPRRPPSR